MDGAFDVMLDGGGRQMHDKQQSRTNAAHARQIRKRLYLSFDGQLASHDA